MHACWSLVSGMVEGWWPPRLVTCLRVRLNQAPPACTWLERPHDITSVCVWVKMIVITRTVLLITQPPRTNDDLRATATTHVLRTATCWDWAGNQWWYLVTEKNIYLFGKETGQLLFLKKKVGANRIISVMGKEPQTVFLQLKENVLSSVMLLSGRPQELN